MLPYMYIVIWVTAIAGLELFDYIREGIADVVEKQHKSSNLKCPVNGDPDYEKNLAV